MLSKIIKKFVSKYLSEDDIIELSIDKLSPRLELYTKEQEDDVFKQLQKIDGFDSYLSSTLAADIKRYFKVQTPIEQFKVKGAYSRTYYILQKLKRVNEISESPSKVEGFKLKRYA